MTNQNRVRKIFKDLEEVFLGLPCYSQLSPGDRVISDEIFCLLRRGLCRMADYSDLASGCVGGVLGDFKNAYFTACQLRLRLQIEAQREVWSDVIAHVEIAEKTFDDFASVRSRHQAAVDAFAASSDYDDSDKIVHYDELRKHVDDMVEIARSISRGQSDFEDARKHDGVIKWKVPLIVGIATIAVMLLIELGRIGYSEWKDQQKNSAPVPSVEHKGQHPASHQCSTNSPVPSAGPA